MDMQDRHVVVPGVLCLTRTGTVPHVTELCQACSAAGNNLEHSPSTPESHSGPTPGTAPSSRVWG